MTSYKNIAVGGGDTSQPLALEKRLRYIRDYLVPERRRFLDCGCGAGDYVFQLVEALGLDAHGIEYEAKKVQRGKLHAKHGDRISQGDIQAIASDSEQWDYAMMNEVLEHVPDDLAAAKEVWRILKPGGVLFVFSPNRWFPCETHGVSLKRSGRNVPHWFPFIPYVPVNAGSLLFKYRARNYWQRELRGLVTSAGFTVIKTGFIWPTFEGISGNQPKLITRTKTGLRKLSDTFERLPFLTRFGVSQVLICRKQ